MVHPVFFPRNVSKSTLSSYKKIIFYLSKPDVSYLEIAESYELRDFIHSINKVPRRSIVSLK